MIMHSNLSKMKDKTLPTCLQWNYRDSLGESNNASCGLFEDERVNKHTVSVAKNMLLPLWRIDAVTLLPESLKKVTGLTLLFTHVSSRFEILGSTPALIHNSSLPHAVLVYSQLECLQLVTSTASVYFLLFLCFAEHP